MVNPYIVEPYSGNARIKNSTNNSSKETILEIKIYTVDLTNAEYQAKCSNTKSFEKMQGCWKGFMSGTFDIEATLPKPASVASCVYSSCEEFGSMEKNDTDFHTVPSVNFENVFTIIQFPNGDSDSIYKLRDKLWSNGWLGKNVTTAGVTTFVENFNFGQLEI